MYWKLQFLYKIWRNKMLCRPTIPSFSELKPETHIYVFCCCFFCCCFFAFNIYIYFFFKGHLHSLQSAILFGVSYQLWPFISPQYRIPFWWKSKHFTGSTLSPTLLEKTLFLQLWGDVIHLSNDSLMLITAYFFNAIRQSDDFVRGRRFPTKDCCHSCLGRCFPSLLF